MLRSAWDQLNSNSFVSFLLFHIGRFCLENSTEWHNDSFVVPRILYFFEVKRVTYLVMLDCWTSTPRCRWCTAGGSTGSQKSLRLQHRRNQSKRERRRLRLKSDSNHETLSCNERFATTPLNKTSPPLITLLARPGAVFLRLFLRILILH